LARQASPRTFILFWTVTAVVTRALAAAAMSLFGFRIPWDVPVDAIGQALVLSTVVSWQWWWALATVCSGLLTRFLAPMFLGGGEGVVYIGAGAIAVVAALPEWLVLRRYGPRSFLYLGVPVLLMIAVAPIYSWLGFPRLVVDGGYSFQWVGTMAVMGLIAGPIEAAALVWILAPEFQRPVPEPAPPNPPAIAMSVMDPSRIAGVRIYVGTLIALAVPIFAPKLFLETWGFPDPDIIPFALAAIAPWAVALALLWRPGLFHAGLALAATAAIIMLVGMIPLMVLVTVMSGMVLGDTDEWVTYLGAMGATVMLVIVAVQAIRTARSLPDSVRLSWSWPAALAGCFVYGVIVVAALA